MVVDVGVSGAYRLLTYPNPWREQATIEFALSDPGHVILTLYNTLGQHVKTVFRGRPSPNETRRLSLDVPDQPSGLYFVRLTGEGVSATKRLTIVR